MLDENRAKELVVRRTNLDSEGRAQARTQVTELYPPRPEWPASGDQQAAPVLDARIVKVEQGEFRGPIRIVDRDPLWNLVEKPGQHRLGQGFSSDDDGQGAVPPEMCEMRLAATGRAMDHQSCRRPIGPSIDPLDGRDVAPRHHEI
jgi:hypothetical protein